MCIRDRFSLGALDADRKTIKGYGHLVGDGDGILTDTRHGSGSGSVHVTEHFSANALFAGIAVAHHAFGSGDDCHPKATKDLG